MRVTKGSYRNGHQRVSVTTTWNNYKRGFPNLGQDVFATATDKGKNRSHYRITIQLYNGRGPKEGRTRNFEHPAHGFNNIADHTRLVVRQ
jgi:hypothetical protein